MLKRLRFIDTNTFVVSNFPTPERVVASGSEFLSMIMVQPHFQRGNLREVVLTHVQYPSHHVLCLGLPSIANTLECLMVETWISDTDAAADTTKQNARRCSAMIQSVFTDTKDGQSFTRLRILRLWGKLHGFFDLTRAAKSLPILEKCSVWNWVCRWVCRVCVRHGFFLSSDIRTVLRRCASIASCASVWRTR